MSISGNRVKEHRARHKLRRAIESGKPTNVIEQLRKEYAIAKVNNPLTNNK